MPTNNQEWVKRLWKVFVAIPTKGESSRYGGWCVPYVNTSAEAMESFIRQEIRQAKIEGLKMAQRIMIEYKEELNAVDCEIDNQIDQAISNLQKQ